ncbi:hypothetical protein COLO4_09388 [Corchorus olitorius]|uniref:RING-type E3 ubiquitin transferase n=1 Tax=Corchorus olitorius TaxID=93759 RepID=A0A1R3KCB4_9ROSI|nr:hypothetical protein COLO4_09388 [Corchorus olitorius]
MSMKPSMMLRFCALTFFFLLFSFSSAEIVAKGFTENETEVFYSDYCSSIVPESITSSQLYTSSFGPFDELETGYYIGGNRILNPKITGISNVLGFETRYVSQTNVDGVYKVEGSLTFYKPFDPKRPFNLKLQGLWSESSEKLCMVGVGSAYSKQGNLLTPSAVFKLTNLKNTSRITTLITGTLESLSSSDNVNYFEPISIIMFPRLNYEYTFDSTESIYEFSSESDDTEKNLPLTALPRRSFCSIISRHEKVFELHYSSNCRSTKQNCLPFGGGIAGYLPGFVSFRSISCSGVKKRSRVLIEFRNNSYVENYQFFNPNTTLIGEGTWDEKKNRLFVFVCQFLDIGESWSNAHVGDCTTRLSLRFPAVYSMRRTSNVMGQMWTKKSVNDSGYFDRIVFQSTKKRVEGVPGLMYEYTEFDRVKTFCPRNEPVRNKGERYPSGNSNDMIFDISVRDSERKSGWGSAIPFAIGDLLYRQNLYPMTLPSSMFETAVPTSWVQGRPINVSYEISITLQTPINSIDGLHFSYLYEEKMEITAEGIYDSQTGNLCMVGCRKLLGSNNQVMGNGYLDCEILLNFQFAPVKPNENGRYIKGSIESTREKSDPLYFNHLFVSSADKEIDDQGRSLIWKTDVKFTMALISNTLVCIFVGLQLHHVKKNPEVLSFISLVMLGILTLSHTVPLVLDFDTLCLNKQDEHKVLSHDGGWFELKEVIVTVPMVVAFLLLLRLLQLTVSARTHNGNRKFLWIAEEKAALVIVFLYAASAKITLLAAWETYKPDRMLLISSHVDHPICIIVKSYASLLLDGFLFPQLLLNLFSNSKQNALNRSFYIGTAFVRLLPHAYDVLIDTKFHFPRGNSDRGFFSLAWDVIIVLGLLFLPAVIHFQQKFGGHCILPSIFRDPEELPLASKSSRTEKASSA